MSLRTALFSYVSGITAVTDQLGTNPTRFYFNQLPEGVTYPACRYFIVSDPANAVHNGGSSGVKNAQVQVDILAENDIDLEAVESAVDNALNGFKATSIKGYRENRVDGFEEANNLMRVTFTYRIQWQES